MAALLHRDWPATPYRLKSLVCATVATVTPASPPGLPKHRKGIMTVFQRVLYYRIEDLESGKRKGK